MKQMIDLVRKAMELKEKDYSDDIANNPAVAKYLHGLVKIIDYLIAETIIPEDMEEFILNMYEASVEKLGLLDANDGQSANAIAELTGACDILAWVLDISEDEHNQNKSRGKLLK